MTGGSLLCGRCGAANVPGDQFCGSCGAFLEWVADPSAPAAPVPLTPDAPGTAPIAVPPSPATPSTAATWGSPASAPSPASPPADEPDASDALVRCPACGIANPADRTFCQTCGATLAAAAPAVAVGRDWAGLPPAAPSRSTGDTLVTSPVPRTSPRPRMGIPGWVLGVAVLGIVVGAAVVGGSVFLRDAAVPSGAAGTAPPSPGASLAASPSASADPVSASPSASPTAPPEGVTIALTGATASSVVGDRPKFDAAKAIDRTRKTAWQEGAAKEAGQWIQVTFAPLARLDAVLISNGYQLNVAAYQGNRRLRDIRITVDGGKPIAVRLKDEAKQQRIDLGGVTGATSVRIEIVSTYGAKRTTYAGSPFDDAAVSEIAIVGVPAP